MAKPSDLIVLATLAAGAGAGAVIDLRTRRVPNALTALLAGLGLAFAVSGISGLTPGAALGGLAVGLALMLPGHLVGATGAGDVKFFAALGTFLGPWPVAMAFFYTALAGGVMALIVAAQRRRLRETVGATARLIATRAANAVEIESALANNRFAYAPAIAVGIFVAALSS